jgi:hypothetical protein
MRNRNIVLVVALVLVALTACSSKSSPSPSSSPSSTTGPTVTPTDPATSSSTAPNTISPTSQNPSADEAATRQAVETAWRSYWTVYDTLLSKPQSSWPATVAAVAVDPIYSQLITQDRAYAKSGIGSYGAVVLHPYWTTPVGGKSTANLMDCQDDSQAGSLDLKTGAKRTVGKKDNLVEGTLVRGTGGTWRVQQLTYFTNKKCEA